MESEKGVYSGESPRDRLSYVLPYGNVILTLLIGLMSYLIDSYTSHPTPQEKVSRIVAQRIAEQNHPQTDRLQWWLLAGAVLVQCGAAGLAISVYRRVNSRVSLISYDR